jgi:hypothetical protein
MPTAKVVELYPLRPLPPRRWRATNAELRDAGSPYRGWKLWHEHMRPQLVRFPNASPELRALANTLGEVTR